VESSKFISVFGFNVRFAFYPVAAQLKEANEYINKIKEFLLYPFFWSEQRNEQKKYYNIFRTPSLLRCNGMKTQMIKVPSVVGLCIYLL